MATCKLNVPYIWIGHQRHGGNNQTSRHDETHYFCLWDSPWDLSPLATLEQDGHYTFERFLEV